MSDSKSMNSNTYFNSMEKLFYPAPHTKKKKNQNNKHPPPSPPKKKITTTTKKKNKQPNIPVTIALMNPRSPILSTEWMKLMHFVGTLLYTPLFAQRLSDRVVP